MKINLLTNNMAYLIHTFSEEKREYLVKVSHKKALIFSPDKSKARKFKTMKTAVANVEKSWKIKYQPLFMINIDENVTHLLIEEKYHKPCLK